MLKHLRAALAALLLMTLPLGAARAAQPWETFTPPPPLPAPLMEGRVTHDGARIWFAVFGTGKPVILLHGAGGSGDNFGFQVPALLASGRQVIVIDSRGQGRSTHDAKPLGYELMETDVIAVMDALNLRKASIVGWSDGAILGLIVAMKHPDRADRIFAYSPNMDVKGLRPDALSQPIIGQAFPWMQREYERLSATPKDFPTMLAAIGTMTQTQPNYTAADLARIRGPAIAIVDGDHEELILPEHTQYLARTIPHARLIILPGVSHFAMLQRPDDFNRAMIAWLDAR